MRFAGNFLLYIYLYAICVVSYPFNTNGTNNVATTNGRLTDEFTCKTDDGRIGIPINGKYRSGVNPCRVCTCTATGFVCEDQCETVTTTTSTTTEGRTTTTATTTTTTTSSTESTTILSTISTSPILNTTIKSILPNTTVKAPLVNTTINGGPISSSTPSMGNGDDDVAPGSPCTRATSAAREYAFVDCGEVYLAGKRTSGIYEIWPRTSPKPFRVLCDMDTDGGGWTVIQRRGDYSQQSNFFITWSSYRRGFGDLTRDFWLGNEKIHALTNQDEYRLHIDLEDFNEQTRFIDYEWFFITSEQTKYTLNLGRYMTTSTGGDSLSYNRGMRFSTRDQDNDQSMTNHCAENYRSGWWHAGCTLANLNGLYLRGNDSTATGVFWNNWLGAKYSLRTCSIKVRPVGFNTEMLSY